MLFNTLESFFRAEEQEINLLDDDCKPVLLTATSAHILLILADYVVTEGLHLWRATSVGAFPSRR